jgi:hypothetical protein
VVYTNMSIINEPQKMKKLWVLLVAIPVSLLSIIAWSSTDETIAQLRLDHAALRAAEDDYRDQREFSGLDGTDAADYAAYIAGLQRRVFEDCQAVVETGSPVPEDLPCPLVIPSVSRSAEIATQREQTPDEQIAALDAMLSAGLGEFDEKLLREQERIKAATPNDNSGDGGAGEGGPGDGDGEGDGEGSAGEGSEGEGSEGEGSEGDTGADGRNTGGRSGNPGETEDGQGQPGRGPDDGSTGSGEAGNDSDEPSDIPDGSDDDVVARQLREAAERETDPELKAKLWEEYRRYKRGTN